MLSLLNFKKDIPAAILKRGEQYYASGMVSGIAQVTPGKWEAEICGTEMYRVSISLNAAKEITEHECDCPYNGPVCKHIAAILYHLDEVEIGSEQPGNSTEEKPLFAAMLQSKTKEELIGFLNAYSHKNVLFRMEFDYFFAGKNENPGKYDLMAFIHRLGSLPVTRLHVLDSILGDLANHLYGIAEEVSNLLEKADGFDSVQKAQTLAEVTALHKELDELAEVFDAMWRYNSKYMDRARHMFAGMYEEVEELVKTLRE